MSLIRVVVQEDEERSYYGQELQILDGEIRLVDYLDPQLALIPLSRVLSVEVVRFARREREKMVGQFLQAFG